MLKATTMPCVLDGRVRGSDKHAPTADSAAPDSPHDRLQVHLSWALAADVIPRLVRSHGVDVDPARDTAVDNRVDEPPDSPRHVDPLVVELARRLLMRAEGPADAYAEALLNEVLSPEALLLDVLAPTARHLGTLWSVDQCDFTAVTVGV
jgi:hypothetical protein